MPTYLEPIEPPVGGLYCQHCADPIVATAEIRGHSYSISGLREYRWTHTHGSDVCRPTTVAQPFDGSRPPRTWKRRWMPGRQPRKPSKRRWSRDGPARD